MNLSNNIVSLSVHNFFAYLNVLGLYVTESIVFHISFQEFPDIV